MDQIKVTKKELETKVEITSAEYRLYGDIDGLYQSHFRKLQVAVQMRYNIEEWRNLSPNDNVPPSVAEAYLMFIKYVDG